MISDCHPSFAPAESATLILPSYVVGAIACSSLTDVTMRVHRPHSPWCLTSDLPRCVGHLVPLARFAIPSHPRPEHSGAPDSHLTLVGRGFSFVGMLWQAAEPREITERGVGHPFGAAPADPYVVRQCIAKSVRGGGAVACQ